MSERKCQVCKKSVPSTVSKSYCYLHNQVYDSLTAEFASIKQSSKGVSMSWKDFLFEKKKSTRPLPKEMEGVIKVELEN
jgi:hypothetical protein